MASSFQVLLPEIIREFLESRVVVSQAGGPQSLEACENELISNVEQWKGILGIKSWLVERQSG